MRPAFFFVVFLLAATVRMHGQPQPSPEAEAFFAKAMKEINPKHVAWVKTSAVRVKQNNLGEAAVRESAKKYAASGSLNSMDIEALVFLTMMQASKSAKEDLKAIMAKVKSINNEKQAMQKAMTRLNNKQQAISQLQLDSFKLLVNSNPSPVRQVNVKPAQTTRTPALDSSKTKRLVSASQPAPASEVNTVKEQVKNKLDSISEMGENESIQLKATSDKQKELLEIISQILKSISQTQNEIIKNLR